MTTLLICILPGCAAITPADFKPVTHSFSSNVKPLYETIIACSNTIFDTPITTESELSHDWTLAYKSEVGNSISKQELSVDVHTRLTGNLVNLTFTNPVLHSKTLGDSYPATQGIVNKINDDINKHVEALKLCVNASASMG
ncbi:hypothetical protein L1D22_00295 [Vibrio sp. Isolate34]|uniref:hypothetical protein n=1 Tax=Vibrio sp. Isolate34 TaxID=2908540 RepID=UPI001EFEB88E|nr:hypothetical protein [Vibrio sp. Isolate34]MCG9638393.1 hypothetical protein [Vibrio sp. Isolate34]